jgi:hypothetical protein
MKWRQAVGEQNAPFWETAKKGRGSYVGQDQISRFKKADKARVVVWYGNVWLWWRKRGWKMTEGKSEKNKSDLRLLTAHESGRAINVGSIV